MKERKLYYFMYRIRKIIVKMFDLCRFFLEVSTLFYDNFFLYEYGLLFNRIEGVIGCTKCTLFFEREKAESADASPYTNVGH